jgi:nitrite reductase/ring-hydroxylating ferredoxin subunit
MTDDTTVDATGLTRRQALAAAAALCGFGAVTAAGTGVAHASGSLRVQLSKHPQLGRIGGVANVGTLNGAPVAVVRTGRSTYVALDRRCPHAGGIVSPSGREWVCPLHNSRFALNTGRKVSGVTPTGLRRLKARLTRGVLTITS